MAVRKCRECSKRVSTEALVCPHCGAPDPVPKRSEADVSNTSKGCLVVFLIVGALWMCGQCGDSSPSSSTSSSLSRSSESRSTYTPPEAETSEERKAKYVERLQRENDDLSNGVDLSEYTDSKDGILIGLVLFRSYAQVAYDGRLHELTEDEGRLLSNFKNRLRREQRRAFPLLRDAYGPAVRRELWEHHMKAKTFGSGYRTIEFIGSAFAANRNIQDWQSGVQDVLRELRFRQARYKWYDGASEYTYYDFESPDDDEIVIWNNGIATQVK